MGRAALEVGAISAYDMKSETTLVKLMWCLGHTPEPDRVREMMLINYAGELSFSLGAGVRGNMIILNKSIMLPNPLTGICIIFRLTVEET